MNKCKFYFAYICFPVSPSLSAFSHCIPMEIIFHTSFHQRPTCFYMLRQYIRPIFAVCSCLTSKVSGLRSEQESAGEVMNHHSSISSSLCEGRCAGGEGGKTFTSPAACCVLIFVVALRSRRGGFFAESSASCLPTFSAHSSVSTCPL